MTEDGELTPDEESLTRKAFLGASTATAAGAGLLGASAGAFASGPSESPSERELRKRRLRVVREHAMSENVQKFDETLETFDEPRYEIISTGDVHDGTDEVSEYFVTGRTAFPDQRNSDYRLHYSAGDAKNRPVVILEFKLSGTHKGPLSGIPPTGKIGRAHV